jgi:hypothetical protein
MAGDQCLGTFALYHDTPRAPSRDELDVVLGLSDLAAVVIERHQTIRALTVRIDANDASPTPPATRTAVSPERGSCSNSTITRSRRSQSRGDFVFGDAGVQDDGDGTRLVVNDQRGRRRAQPGRPRGRFGPCGVGRPKGRGLTRSRSS